ncbi:MAG TPA: metal ABC transporter permease [Thermodesulfobacteriota bacterium]|nr:metal ABC transporter permease [Thermodesulfobacteriota bacterium]
MIEILSASMTACVLLVGIHAYFGIHVLSRGIIFIDLALAQTAALGVAVSYMFGYEPQSTGSYLFALIFAVLGSILMTLTRVVKGRVNVEALIGIIYILATALTILALDRAPHGSETMKALFNGNLLWLTWPEIGKTAVIYALVGIFHFIFRERFLNLSLEGRGSLLWEFLFFLSFAVVITSSVHVGGILIVFSYLIIPALVSGLFAKGIGQRLLISWSFGIIVSLAGLILSYRLDLPTGALVVALLSLSFFAVLAVGYRRKE